MSDLLTNPTALVVTTIHSPSDSLRQFAAGCGKFGIRMIVIGDRATPADFELPGCAYYDLKSQCELGFRLSLSIPVACYARKNLGYLIALRQGALVILESDDDNLPLDSFFAPRRRRTWAAHVVGSGWVNVYSYFAAVGTSVWPRGFPLDAIRTLPPAYEKLPFEELDCPIQQGLVDGDADVDAIFRLIYGDAPGFRAANPVAVGPGSWCPVNSQNTAWWAEAAPLLYLPAHCSFRMTDIWRGIVAQRIAWENGWNVLFHSATASQNRNQHDLMKDFEDEIPGYLGMRSISEMLSSISLSPGARNIPENLRVCYAALVEHGVFDEAELLLLEDWLADLTTSTGN
jgi:hypothetical protein